MNLLDYVVLFASILGIALYGILRTRGRRNLHDYLRGKKHSWLVIGISVMATQASAVTFLSTPGQGYSGGLSFVQNYFAVPVAMVIIAAFFLPIYRKLNVYTAYEYLSTRFDKKTRLLAAGIFLLQRALNAGYTVYAPAIVLSSVFGWSLSLTIIASSVVCIVYTVVGGSDAVTDTQKYQFAIIMIGMVTAFCILLSKIPCSFSDALTLAGHFGKTNAVSFSVNPSEKYTVWTGMLGGIFLMLSYFGTDQSQVQRYISGDNLRASRLGLMFNGLMKIPMQFGILLLGVMLFVFYQFHPAPMFFNRTELARHQKSQASVSLPLVGSLGSEPASAEEGFLLKIDQEFFVGNSVRQSQMMQQWLRLRQSGDFTQADAVLAQAKEIAASSGKLRTDSISAMKQVDPSMNTNDSDYVFITFILDNLPHGLIGLLVTCFFAATLNAKSSELNSLASCSVIDFYRYLIRPPRGIGVPPMAASLPEPNAHGRDAHATPPSVPNPQSSSLSSDDRHYVRASRAFTILWGIVALIFALFLFRYFSDNLIEATNIVGSVFYGVILGLFLIAFFIKFIHGNAAFWGAVLAEALVLSWFILGAYFPALHIAYLWYNLIGTLACIFFATILQLILGPPRTPQGFPVILDQ